MKGKRIAKSHKPFHSSTSHMRANRQLRNWVAAFAFDILNENDRLTEVEHTVFILFGECIDFLCDSKLGI